jgi:single-strand DNA-binding protein
MASRSVNKVLLLGHLGKDAEGKFLPSGVHVAKFSVATSRRWKDKGSDEWKEETEWTNVSLWRSENLVPYLTKGKQVYVEGRLQTRNYEDKEGQKRYSTEVVADEVILVGGGGGEKQHGGGLVSQPRGAQQAKQTSPMELTDDDIPW